LKEAKTMAKIFNFLSKHKVTLNNLEVLRRKLEKKPDGQTRLTLPKKEWVDINTLGEYVKVLVSHKAPKLLLVMPMNLQVRELRNQIEALQKHLDKIDALKIK